MPAEAFLHAKAEQVEAALDAYLKSLDGVPPGLEEAMRYSLFAGGKRLRPALCLGAGALVGGDSDVAMSAACALEMIHTYSLVHDDLPAMDDDALRRGKPTSHIKFDEATAILVGDGLQALAFEIIADMGNIDVIREVAQASGASGMVGGQYLDLQSEGKTLALDELQHLHRSKTGALIRASVRVGAMLGDANSKQLESLTSYGEHIGLAFQIIDDILDVTGDEASIGKPVGSDAAHNKSTFPALVGLDEAQRLAREAVDAAVSTLDDFGTEADAFRDLAHYIIERNR
ncbi:MAG: geranyl transferase [Candidatus Hydrogenedentota bacterium]|nr:MAG: geranyl transferase [Candidatus Hydrogenedentota bacterium]